MPPLQDEIALLPSPSSGNNTKPPLLIFFICGNPGLIEYYHAFLLHLHSSLAAKNSGHSAAERKITIYGASHEGFEIHPSPRRTGRDPPFSLKEEIEGVKKRLVLKVREMMAGGVEGEVVLMGHSVGAYMLLEVLEWWREREEREGWEIIGGVCLFPTVVDIAKSPRGRVLSWVLAIPFLPILLQYLARCVACIPTSWIDWPRILHPGSEAVGVTEAMIRSRHGVRQTIYMANDEMREIKEDRWHPSNIWGMLPRERDDDGGDVTTTATISADSKSSTKTKLFFYWGKNDYWVNNQSRDALIAARAQTTDDVKSAFQPQMFVDPGEIPHTFSLETKDMVTVAEKVAEFIAEL